MSAEWKGRVPGGTRPSAFNWPPARATDGLKRVRVRADTFAVADELSPLAYLNEPERRLLGPLVHRLCATGNTRFQRALEENGPEATARMACVNALRIYAIALFAVGVLAR